MITFKKLLLTSQVLHFTLSCGCFSPKCFRTAFPGPPRGPPGVWETGRGFPEGRPNREHNVEGAPKARDPRVTDDEGYLRQVATTPP